MKAKLFALLSTGLLLLALTTGCTHVRKTEFANPVLNSGTPPIPARVALVISPEVGEFHHKYNMMGDTWDYPFGSPLLQYVRHVAGNAFAGVKEFPTTAAAANQADAVLVVDSPKAEHTMPMLAWQKRAFVLRLNWTVNDRSGQSPLWLKTMEGQGEHTVGNAFTGSSNEKKLIQALFTDLSMKTYEALTSSPELKQIPHAP